MQFAGINFRGRRILKDFAELTFAEKAKKRETAKVSGPESIHFFTFSLFQKQGEIKFWFLFIFTSGERERKLGSLIKNDSLNPFTKLTIRTFKSWEAEKIKSDNIFTLFQKQGREVSVICSSSPDEIS